MNDEFSRHAIASRELIPVMIDLNNTDPMLV